MFFGKWRGAFVAAMAASGIVCFVGKAIHAQAPALLAYPSQHAASLTQRPGIDYSTGEDYGLAVSNDIGKPYYLRQQDADPKWTIRPRGMASDHGYAQQAGYAAAQSVPQQPAPFKLLNGATRPVPSKLISSQEGTANNAPAPPPPSDTAMGSAADQSNAACESCNRGSCQCDSCDGNCSCCDSCCGDCCQSHCCLPLIRCHECCPLQCCDTPVEHIFGDCCCLKCNDTTITGWLNGGIMGNGWISADRFNGPETFSDRRGEGQANQQWISLDRTAPADNCGWFLGGHVDYFFGSDYFFTTAAGLDGTSQGNFPRWNTDSSSLYGFAMPQLYVETDYGNDLKIKYGHFFTIIGYEVVPAIGNFFYSHAYTMQYGEPFTHTGILATGTNCKWTYSGGIVGGWNTFNTETRAAFIGGATYADKDWGSLAFSIISGDDSEFNLPGIGPFASRTMYSLVWSRNFTSRLTYVLQHDLGTQNQAQTFRGGGAQWFGVNQYLFYKLNCCWTAGMRVEWFCDDDGFVVTGLRPGNAIQGASFPGNFYEVTLGLNYKPSGNLAVRPEIRWDRYEGQPNQNQFLNATFPFNAGTSSTQFTYGIDLIYQF